MPNIMKYFFDISFSQDDYIYNEFEDKLLFIFNKFVATNDSNITEGITGLCAALSAEYLTHVRQGGLEQGKHYLESIKILTKILDEEIYSHTSPYLKANLQAKKLHAQEKINRLLIDLANRQRASFDMLDIASYEPAYWYWPKKESTETLANYIERVSEYENNVQILYKDRFWFKEFFLETALQVDNESYTTEEVKFFANNALIALKKKYLEKYINYYNQRGLKTINNSQKYILNEINFDEFIKTSIDIEDIDKNKYFEFCSEDHMMAIVIEKNRAIGKLTYAFFDPNYGVIQTDNKYVFIQFLNYIVKIRDDIYRFPGFQNDTVNVFVSEMEYDDLITEHVILPVIDENLVNITTNKILCENRDNFILDYKVKIIFKQFNDNNRTTTIELISEKIN